MTVFEEHMLPGGQVLESMQFSLPSWENCPCPHCRHDVSPARAYWPAAQTVHANEPAFADFPGGQISQDPIAACLPFAGKCCE